MGDEQNQQQAQTRPMPQGNEEANHTPGAAGQNPPSTTSEPGYGGQQGQRQPEGGERPGGGTRSGDRSGPFDDDKGDEMSGTTQQRPTNESPSR